MNANKAERLGLYISYDAAGYRTGGPVSVWAVPGDDRICATLEIGGTMHRADDVTISGDGDRIEHRAGWYLVRV